MRSIGLGKWLICAALMSAPIVLASCEPRQTDPHSEMSGGHESGSEPGLGNHVETGYASNTDGMGRPIAGGKQNVVPDTLSNRDTAMTHKPF